MPAFQYENDRGCSAGTISNASDRTSIHPIVPCCHDHASLVGTCLVMMVRQHVVVAVSFVPAWDTDGHHPRCPGRFLNGVVHPALMVVWTSLRLLLPPVAASVPVASSQPLEFLSTPLRLPRSQSDHGGSEEVVNGCLGPFFPSSPSVSFFLWFWSSVAGAAAVAAGGVLPALSLSVYAYLYVSGRYLGCTLSRSLANLAGPLVPLS